MKQKSTLARYEVLHELGRSATGAVYAARDRATGSVVALKTLDPELSKKPGTDIAERFLRYAGSARRLKHRNIVRIVDAGEADGIAYVAMEMLEGESLRKILDAGSIPIARAVQIVHDIASGLAHAHLEGVVHGGLRPSNVIVLPSGAVKITDFGLAQLREEAGYLSPEQLRGDAVDHRSDLFSLGAVFYEMLTHRPPEIHAEPPLPSELNPHVPRALDRIVFNMLARDADERTPGAPVLLRDLQHLAEGLGLGSGESSGSDEPAPSAPPAAPAAKEPEVRDRITDREAFNYHTTMLMMDRLSRQERSSGSSRPTIFAALAFVLALVAIGLAGFMYYSSGLTERGVVASHVQETPPQEPPPRKPVATEPPPAAEPVTTPAPEQEPAPPQAAEPTAKTPEQQPAGTAQLIVAISPRGEIFIDGKHHGSTPPLTTFELEPGMHRIEVRSGSRKPYLTYMTVEAGDVRRIRHDFNATSGRPPS